MLEKTLHTGNIAAAFGTLATTAADLTVCGGAATTIGALLSGISLFKSNTAAKTLAEQMGNAFKTAMEASPLSRDSKKLIPQIMQKYPVTEDIIAQGNMVPMTVAAIVRAQIEARREIEDPALTGNAMLTAYEAILTQTLEPVLDQPLGMDPMQAAVSKVGLERSDETLALLKAVYQNQEVEAALKQAGITEDAIRLQAEKITGETDDLSMMWHEIVAFIDRQTELNKRAEMRSNASSDISHFDQDIAALSRKGEYDVALNAIEEKLKQTEAEQIRLMDSGVEVALLKRDTAKAAALLVRKADVEAGFPVNCDDIENLREHYYEVGIRSGTMLFLLVAIALSKIGETRATNKTEAAAARNSLGACLITLGDLEGSIERINEGIQVLTSALSLQERLIVPLDWAMTQMNIASALTNIGKRTGDLKLLKRAVIVHKLALDERTRENGPYNWAMSQQNLGVSLRQCGVASRTMQRNTDAYDYFQQSISAFSLALEVRTVEADLEEWAMTNSNLANSLQDMFEATRDATYLYQAIAIYTECMATPLKTAHPQMWAMVTSNLGDAYAYLGGNLRDLSLFDSSNDCYLLALTERTIDRVPFDHAMTQFNFALSLKERYLLSQEKDDLHNGANRVLVAGSIFQARGAFYLSGRASSLHTEISVLLESHDKRS